MVVLCMYSVRTSMSEYIQGVRIPDVKLLLCPWSQSPSPFPTATSDLDVPAASRKARTESGRESRSKLNFLQFGHFWGFPQIWETPKLTLSLKKQKLGGYSTLERTLTRLKIVFRSVFGDSASTSEKKNRDCNRIRELSRSFGNL